MDKKLYKAAQSLKEGKIVLLPTETVFGVCVIYDSYEAYKALVDLKKRPLNKAFPVVVSSYEQIEELCEIDDYHKKAIKSLLPGPVTIILKLKESAPNHLGDKKTVAIRYSLDEQLNELVKLVGKPLLLTSANLSGEEPIRSVIEAKSLFGDGVSVYLDGDLTYGLASTIVSFIDTEPKIIRKGPISLEEIKKHL